MSDLNFGALFHLMGKILLAVIEFVLSIAPIGLLAFISAWLVTFEERDHFLQAKLPRMDAVAKFHVGFMVAHGFLTFFFALLWGVDGMSSLAVIAYSLGTVYAVAIGIGLGGLMLGIMWHLVETHVLKTSASGDRKSGCYDAVSTNEHELESETNEGEENGLPNAKES